MMDGIDAFEQQAFGVLTSSQLAERSTSSKSRKPCAIATATAPQQHQGDGAPRLMQQFLMARRLVEAGVRCVTVSFSFWDYHGSNFALARQNLPPLDQGVSALVEDLHERGLDKDVTVIVWGEFGRTPKINAEAGRDHWPNVSCALLAGGGHANRPGHRLDRPPRPPKPRTARCISRKSSPRSTTAWASTRTRPPSTTWSGRPQYLADHYPPIAELI